MQTKLEWVLTNRHHSRLPNCSSNCKFNREHGKVPLHPEVVRTASRHNVSRESGGKRDGVEKIFEAKIETHDGIRASGPGPTYMRMSDRKRALSSERSDMNTYLDGFDESSVLESIGSVYMHVTRILAACSMYSSAGPSAHR